MKIDFVTVENSNETCYQTPDNLRSPIKNQKVLMQQTVLNNFSRISSVTQTNELIFLYISFS